VHNLSLLTRLRYIIILILLVVALSQPYFWVAIFILLSFESPTRESSDTDIKSLSEVEEHVIKTYSPTYTSNNTHQYDKLFVPDNLKFISKEDKDIYLQSPEWHALKQQRLSIANHSCESCGQSNIPLELHHITYERLTMEHIDDLRIVCRNCHQSIHDTYGYDRTTYYPIS